VVFPRNEDLRMSAGVAVQNAKEIQEFAEARERNSNQIAYVKVFSIKSL
tara:strand:- start:325 stop:471 length:147 start_codon:yes stop_codon:yes gene_type:complete